MKGLFLWAMSQVPCLHEHLANAARVNTIASYGRIALGVLQTPCPVACSGVIDSCGQGGK